MQINYFVTGLQGVVKREISLVLRLQNYRKIWLNSM